MVATAIENEPLVLSVNDVAKLLACSSRHIYRLCDGGLMPRPLKLGGLNRWLRSEVDTWLKSGANPVQTRARRET
jgi:excisionase family DNA binding protein